MFPWHGSKCWCVCSQVCARRAGPPGMSIPQVVLSRVALVCHMNMCEVSLLHLPFAARARRLSSYAGRQACARQRGSVRGSAVLLAVKKAVSRAVRTVRRRRRVPGALRARAYVRIFNRRRRPQPAYLVALPPP